MNPPGLLLLCLALLTTLPVPVNAEALCGPDKKITVGVFPRRNPAITDTMFSPMVQKLGHSLGCAVELKTASDFSHFWDGVETQAYDLVHYNQYHYTKSSSTYEVVAHNEEFGSGTISGTLYTRRDSGLNDLHDLSGKTIVFGGGPDAMMSHIVPRYLLINAGVLPKMYRSVYAPNPPNAVLTVYYKQADAGGAGDVVIRLPVVTRNIDPKQLQAIATSEPLIHLPWAVKRSLPKVFKDRLRSALLALGQDESGKAALKSAGMTGIAPATDEDYDRCRAIISSVRDFVPVE